MKKKNLFGLLCLVGSLGLSSCGPTGPTTTPSTDTGTGSGSTEQPGQFGEVPAPDTTENLLEENKAYSTYVGEARYNTQYGSYGVGVDVWTDASKIVAVNFRHLDVHNITPSWTGGSGNVATMKEEYKKASITVTNNLKGKTIDEAKEIVKGVENSDEFVSKNPTPPTEFQIVTGATQTNLRLAIAVKEALNTTAKSWKAYKDLSHLTQPNQVEATGATHTRTGEVKYNNFVDYGAKAVISLDGDQDTSKIIAVNIQALDGAVNASPTMWADSWSKHEINVLTDSFMSLNENLTKIFKDKTVTEAKDILKDLTIGTDNKPDFTTVPEAYKHIVAGASETSGRSLAAVKKALEAAAVAINGGSTGTK